MAAIPGVRVTGKIVPTDTTDTYAATDPIYGIDGWRGVATAAERNAITTERRREGMIAYQEDTDQLWQLNAAPWIGTDADWTLRSFGGSPGGANTQVQFNNAGAFGGNANFTIVNDELKAAFVRLTSALTFDSEATQALAVNTNDLPAPTVNGLRLNVTANCNLTGINPITLTNSMTLLLIVNVGSNTVTLKNNDAGSLAANRFLFDADLDLTPNNGCVLLYDLTSLRWRLVAKTAGGLPAGGNTQLQYNDNGVFGADSNLAYDAGAQLLHAPAIVIEGTGVCFDVLNNVGIAVNTNNLPSSGLNVLRVDCSAASNLTGLDPAGFVGVLVPLWLYNVGVAPLTLKNQDAGSAAVNRFLFGTDIVLQPDSGCMLVYDGLSARWRMVGRSIVPGTESRKITTITAAGTTALTAADCQVEIDATAGNIVITIPTAASVADGANGRVYHLKRVDSSANSVTVNRSGGDTFVTTTPGNTSFTMATGDALDMCGNPTLARWSVG
jgi:hypothetical protein